MSTKKIKHFFFTIELFIGQQLEPCLHIIIIIIIILLFINCNWVVTRWQYTITHKQYIAQHT
jgi:hypothetical protein